MTQEEKEPGWIKVSDRLPEEGYCIVSAYEQGWFDNGEKVGVFYFFDTTADQETVLNYFSHWQPIILPLPPKE